MDPLSWPGLYEAKKYYDFTENTIYFITFEHNMTEDLWFDYSNFSRMTANIQTRLIKTAGNSTDSFAMEQQGSKIFEITRWFKYDREDLCINKSQFVPVIFEPPCTSATTHKVIRLVRIMEDRNEDDAGANGIATNGMCAHSNLRHNLLNPRNAQCQ
jgi:hypothetical protein